MSGSRVELLGPPHVTVDDEPLEVDTRKAIALLARLVVDGAQRRDTLAPVLWPDSDGTHARAALRRTLSALNKGLDGRWVDADREEIRLETDGLWADVTAFEDGLDRADVHGHEPDATCQDCLDALEEAVALPRGDFLEGFHLRDAPPFDDWRSVEDERLGRRLRGALDRLISIHTHRGDLDVALGHGRRRLELEPLHEPTHRRMMLLHAWKGQRGEVMRQYRECVWVLQEELGVAPLERTTELHDAIIAGRAPDRPAPSPPRPVHRPSADTPHPAPPLVGRSRQLDQLRSAHEASRRSAHVVLVEGEAGVGKTSLIGAFLDELDGSSVPVASVRCYEEERQVAYAVAGELLRSAVATRPPNEVPDAWISEAARLAPELLRLRPDLQPSGAVETSEGRRRLLEGIRQVIAGTLGGAEPGVIAIDDVQWADDASLAALAYVLRRSEDLPLCVVLGSRTRRLPPEHSLPQVLDELGVDDRAVSIELGRFDRERLRDLIETMGVSVDRDVTDRLARESEGLPLLAVEYLHALEEDDKADPWRTPTGIRNLLERQVNRLSDGAQQVLSAAAVIGRSFDLDMLLDVSGRDLEEAIDALEELTSANIVAEIGGGDGPRYDFRHHKLRDIAYDGTSAARRRLLHGRAATGLEKRRHRGPQGRTSAGVLAHHLRAAGRKDEAARTFVAAAEEALELSAHAEAISHLRAALELGHPEREMVHRELGDLLTLRGDYSGALHAYSAAAAHTEDPVDRARIEHRIANVHERSGDWASADAHIDAGLEALPDDGSVFLRARLLTDRALVAYRRGDTAQARRQAERALVLAADDADELTHAQALNILGMLARAEGDPVAATDRLEDSLSVARRLDDPTARIASLNNLSLAYADRGEPAAGLELAKTALGLCRRQGDLHREAAILNNVADLLYRAGQRDEALDYIKRAVAIFAEIGEPDDHEPEIWKLVDW